MALREMGEPRVKRLTLSLGLEYRDMISVKGERPIKGDRISDVVERLRTNTLFTLYWSKCLYNDKWWRTNGNHTSHTTVASMQLTVEGHLDKRSEDFVKTFILDRRTKLSYVDVLPPLNEGKIYVVEQTWKADTYKDLIDSFRVPDSRRSVRSSLDILRVHQSEHTDLDGLSTRNVARVLSGVLAVALINPRDLGFADVKEVRYYKERDNRGAALHFVETREAIKWLLGVVEDPNLYAPTAGAQVLLETYLEWGKNNAEAIITELERQYRDEEDPGRSYAVKLVKRGRPTPDHLVTAGRKTVAAIAQALGLMKSRGRRS